MNVHLSKKPWPRKRFAKLGRELFFFASAMVILYQQVFVASTAQPILVFLALFFLGSIPALRGDGESSFLSRLLLALLGMDIPPSGDSKQDSDEDTKPSSGPS
jgi:hypothetical protein